MFKGLARALVFIIVIGGGILSLQYITGHFKAERQVIILNRTRPDFHDLLTIDKDPAAAIPRGGLKGYFDYFRLVASAMPDNSDGPLMLGYLYTITGDGKKGGDLFKEAYRLDPKFFFTAFNMALISWQAGDYKQSAALLEAALAVGPEATLKRMMASTIYRQIFSSMDDSRDIIASLQKAYQDASLLLIESKTGQGVNAGVKIHAHIM